MDAVLSKPVAVVLIVVLLVGALVGVQAVAQIAAPAAASTTDTAALLGNTSFAYLGGLRIFAAAVLWNRLEPQFDEYYRTKRLQDLTFLLPSLYLVQMLNPNYVQAYYNAAFILAKRGQWDEAFRVAREGIKNNPRSGLMRANYVQVLLMRDVTGNLNAAYDEALAGISAGMTYDTIDDEYESLGIFRNVFEKKGRSDLVAALRARQAQLRAAGAQGGGLTGGSESGQ